MNTQFILIGLNKLIWLEEYTDKTNGLHYSEGYYIFPELATINLETSPITE
jgi:hypothetical protein